MSNKRSVCFFMAVYGRKKLTRMSIYHMKRVMGEFESRGHSTSGFICCNEDDQGSYAESLGIEYFKVPNKPLGIKFSKMFNHALFKETDYICWMGSNNVHSEDYIQKCIEKIEGPKVVSFGCKKFLVAHADPLKRKTCVFRTRTDFHVCSSMQFYLNYSISNAVNFRTIYAPDQTHNFDGKINHALVDKWGDGVVETISSKEDDCLDIKDETNIHSYDSYIKKAPDIYPFGPSRSVLSKIYPEIKLLDEGYFDLVPDKSAEQEDEPSE